MKKIKVAIPGKPYYIYIGKDALKYLPSLITRSKIGQDVVLITTDKLLKLHGKKIKNSLKTASKSMLILSVPDSEKSKSANIALKLIEKITIFDKKKKLFIAAFGGGVVGDVSGFIAAIYKRGIPYIQIPTTLLAQIDSSIGGKTAIDTGFGKNLVGAFYQPKFVLSDTALLKTLPIQEIRAGLSEAVKYAVIKDNKLFDFISKELKDIIGLNNAQIDTVILKCAQIKAKTVAQDELDQKGIRIVLNFGHTFGHAIEAASDFNISHGEAVSIGMVCACRLSVKLGLLKNDTALRVEQLLKNIGLPVRIKNAKPTRILSSLSCDKKFSKGANRFVLLEKIGKIKVVENIPERLIREIIAEAS